MTKCPGCGRQFKGERGLRAHQSQRFVAMGCRSQAPEWWGEPCDKCGRRHVGTCN